MHGADRGNGITEEAQADENVWRQFQGHAKKRRGREGHKPGNNVASHLLHTLIGPKVGLIALLAWPSITTFLMQNIVVVIVPL